MVIWLLNPLVTQIGASGLQWTFVFLVAVAMACWLLGRIEMTMPVLQRWRYRIGAAATVIAAGVVIYGLIQPLGAAQARQQVVRMASYGGDDTSSGIPWQSWSEEAVEREARSGRMVFVDFTAAWCTVCKVNKKMATDTPDVRDKLKSLGIVPFQADFTSRDPKIAAALQKYGPPLNLIYPAGRPDGPIVLRPILTKAYLLEKLDEAAGSARTAAAGARGS